MKDFEVTHAAIDVAEKVIEDVKQAADAVCDAVVSGVATVQNAWDNLDPGLKQWLLMGASLAISVIPGIGIAERWWAYVCYAVSSPSEMRCARCMRSRS
ncbi:MAG: hypothetical protein A3K60_08930 [Euryarchaeota archaeon RBG_19FT_COMBO_56_21]|nr:MAG: hypothetical protein A3K60_08930 [Euryarchaeota archaeon RBG_19FT_COMBO_56_21]